MVAIQSFASPLVDRFFTEGRVPKGAGWAKIASVATRKLDMLDYAATLSDLASPPGDPPVRSTSKSVTTTEEAEGTMSATRRRRPPTRPGEILREEFLVPLGLTQKELADHLGCDVKVVNRIVNGRTSVTAAMALKLGATFRTTPEFWLNAQKAVDLHRAAHSLHELPEPMVRAG